MRARQKSHAASGPKAGAADPRCRGSRNVAKPHNKEKKCGWMRINPHMCGFFGNPDGTRTLNENEHAVRLLRLVTLGYAWLRLVTLGYAWLRLVTLGYAWLRLVTLGYAWLRLVTLGYASLRFAGGKHKSSAHVGSRWLEHSGGNARPAFRAGFLQALARLSAGFARLLPTFCKDVQGYLKFSKYACRSEWRR